MDAALRTIGIIVIAVVVALAAGFGLLILIGGLNQAPRNADGAIEGTATNVRSDQITLETSSGGVRIDTWSVCGDRTRSHISEGDELTVYADRDLLDYEAWRILDSGGEPACSG